MRIFNKNSRGFREGFTLIELLVVIAIISLVSSIVLASLSLARNKTRDTAIKAEMNQLANVMEMNYQDYGSYCQIQPSAWVNASGTCDALLSGGSFYGSYAQKAHDLCQIIYNNAGTSFGVGTRLYMNLNPPATCAQSYSWSVLLNDNEWYCAGSSGKGEYWSYSAGNLGCWDNP
jgi:prepilin-type N-terminal cleavage/methylation domain-containing protein